MAAPDRRFVFQPGGEASAEAAPLSAAQGLDDTRVDLGQMHGRSGTADQAEAQPSGEGTAGTNGERMGQIANGTWGLGCGRFTSDKRSINE